jgi:3-isopropylmalate/(R)-2-methylmalate dehydratase small subunit
MTIKGTVWKYGDDVNTDMIFPGKYTYTVTDPAEMGEHALEDLDPDFCSSVQPGDVIVGGKNFGCGSSREQAVICLVAKGLGAVVATSFGRIFYRNAINNALPVIACPQAVEALERGDEVEVDLEAGEIHTAKGTFTFPPLPEAVMSIFDAGGLIPYVRRQLGIEA